MIAKRVSHRKDRKSSIQQLAKYIADKKNDGEKVLHQAVNNCQSDDPEWAAIEIQATQDANTRAKGDKTYHLVVSFPEGENPTKNQLRDIEDGLCRFIGLGDHQRISAVHTDTDNLHVHIAINKVHSESLKMIEPYYDHYRLSEACQALEQKHGLLVDSHALPGQAADRKAIPLDEMRSGGQVPLADWLQERVNLDGVKKWQSLHKGLAQVGVEVKPKGAGFVFLDKASGIAVKASAVSRDLSGGKLVAMLGDYQAPSIAVTKVLPTEVYTAGAGVTDDKAARAALWAEFSQERELRGSSKKTALAELRKHQKIDLDAIKEKYAKRREELKAGKLVKLRRNKRGFYSLLKAEKLRAIGTVKDIYSEKREGVVNAHRQPDWRDWLQEKADQGNEDALKSLRNVRERLGRKQNRFEGTREDHTLYQSYDYHIHRDGKVTYRFGDDGFTDNGNKLILGKQPSDTAIEAALKMAVQKYGGDLKVGGDQQFKAKAAKIAERLKFNLVADEEKQVPFSPIADYVQERNSKRINVLDILKHKEFKKNDAGQFEMAGLRNLGDVRAVLLKQGDEILVKEVKESQYMKLKNVKRGEVVNIDKQGRIVKNAIKKGRK